MLRGIDALREAGCNYNVLTLVTNSNVNEPKKIYRYVRDELGGKWQQYTDHLESISTQQWDKFLCGASVQVEVSALLTASKCVCDGHLVYLAGEQRLLYGVETVRLNVCNDQFHDARHLASRVPNAHGRT